MHVRARMHLNCANERNQMQKATYYMISCQWISGNGTTVGTEMHPWLPGYRSGGRNLTANGPREHFWTLRRFPRFDCGSIYTTVYICQKSTNGNMLKCWLLLYINYTSILFLKEKEILSIGYCIHLDHELKNIKIVFWNSSETWPTSRIPHDTFVPLWQGTETWSKPCWQFPVLHLKSKFLLSLSILLHKRLMCLHFPMSTTSALVQSLPPFNCQPPSHRSLISTQGVLFPSSRPLPPSLPVAKLSMTL